MNPSNPMSELVRAVISELLSISELASTEEHTRNFIFRRVSLLIAGRFAPWHLTDASIQEILARANR